MNINDIFSTLLNALDAINTHLPFLLLWLGIAIALLILNVFLGNALFIFGLLPRHPLGLIGIFTSPLIHGNSQHLFMNAIFYLGLGGLVLSQGLDTFIIVSITIITISGSLVWLFGRQAMHVGASSLIVGYWSYLTMRAIIEPTVIQVLGALIGMYYFGIHMAASLLSIKKNVSIEGHIAGLVAGLTTAYFYTDLANYFHIYGIDILDGGYYISHLLNSLIREWRN